MKEYGLFLEKTLNGMPEVYRWQGRRVLKRRNDLEHTAGVAIFAEVLWQIQKGVYGEEVDKGELLTNCLYHDLPEVYSTDIPSGIKKSSSLMKEAIKEVENNSFQNEIAPMLPADLRGEYKQYILNPKQNKKTTLGKILAVADGLDALNEAIQEVVYGNKKFEPYVITIAEDILDIDVECGKYFMKYLLKDFGGIPIEMYGEKVYQFIKTAEIHP